MTESRIAQQYTRHGTSCEVYGVLDGDAVKWNQEHPDQVPQREVYWPLKSYADAEKAKASLALRGITNTDIVRRHQPAWLILDGPGAGK